MYNWSTDEQGMAQNKEGYTIWRLEQMVNFGVDGEKIKKEKLQKYWTRLNLDPHRRRFLELIMDVK